MSFYRIFLPIDITGKLINPFIESLFDNPQIELWRRY